MEDLKITSILTNNGTTMAYELSDGRQITLENAIELAKNSKLKDVAIVNDNGFEYLIGTSNDNFSLNNVPHININTPSD